MSARLALLALLSASCLAFAAEEPKPAGGEMPAKFTPRLDEYDYAKREVMIPMRDGVKLKTFILVPKGAKNAPMLLTRTPYNAGERIEHFNSPHMAAAVPQFEDTAVAAGYIIVFQDIRGKYGSEGDYTMTRPLRGPLNSSDTDHSTDTYDTIEWLVKNVPESNGRVGMAGGSYEAFTIEMALFHPHPALKAAVPFAPMIDGWMGDDWFHNGAFRQAGVMEYIYDQQATRKNETKWWTGNYDAYDDYLRRGSASDVASSRGLEQLGFWQKLLAHPAYDAFWQNQALDKILAKDPPNVPILIVDGLFDQEDIYGGPALFKALAPKSKKVHLVMGPWNHGQGRREGRGIAAIKFAGDTAGWMRRTVMQPFLDHYLKDGPAPDLPRVLAYETGADEWHRYDSWPRSCASGCPQKSRDLYLLPGGKLGFTAPGAGAEYDEYVSDPAKPVPYRNRPILQPYAEGSTWGEWLVDDQRNFAARTDVLVYETEPLKEPLRVAGEPYAKLFASTSGTDSDWVVKIIDVWPDEYPAEPKMGGYQQPVSEDIFRGRYREDVAVAHALKPNEPQAYRIRLPQVSHTFLPGHRVMVQVQSSWFPLYDRNPQTFVENIMRAKPADYVKATQRVYHAPKLASAIELPVIK